MPIPGLPPARHGRNRAGDVADGRRREGAGPFLLRQSQRRGGDDPDERAAAVGRGCDHEPRPEDHERQGRGGDQAFALPLGPAERGDILVLTAGHRHVDEQHRPRLHRDGLQQPLDEALVHIAGPAARAILEHADAVHDDVDAALRQERRESVRLEFSHRAGHGAIAECFGLGRGEPARDGHDRKAFADERLGHGLADEARGAEDRDRREGFADKGQSDGFAIMSQTIAITAPKPGKPKANQTRNRRW